MKLLFNNNLPALAASLALALFMLQACSGEEDGHAAHDDHEGEPPGAHAGEDDAHAGEDDAHAGEGAT